MNPVPFLPLLLALGAPHQPVATPGADTTSYFQQGVDYRIEARLDETTAVLTARARLVYVNNSQATLDTLWFHLHLNAFRPGSAWASRDLESGNRRFTDLSPDDHAFERLRSVRVGDQQVAPIYPGAPDSTVVAVPLPAPLGPGDRTTVHIDWDARLSTLPRRQGRRGRHFDFAQWYPRIAVFDRRGWRVQPLLPQGEFYGEFGNFDVTLDLASDQIIGATGVPAEGEPGWENARATGSPVPRYRRDAYAQSPAERLGLIDGLPGDGRKRVRWRAEDVHHFAWTTSPDYIYEGGEWNGIAIHVLYQPGDTTWAGGIVVNRTAEALHFMHDVFGTYPWPQLTNVHRIEGGGTEFPMLVMNGSASEGLIMHEVAHNYVHGILANNEWAEGWLDEGLASFLTNWYFEEKGQTSASLWADDMNAMIALEQADATQPIGLAAADFRDFRTYNAMTYTKPALVFRMLRDLMGEARFREGLRRYYDDNQLRHVTESDFRTAMANAYGENLDWFFDQWIHTTDKLDYGITRATATRNPDGSWTAEVEVVREGNIWMPVRLQVGAEVRLLDSRERTQTVTFRMTSRPDEARLDPDDILLDIVPGNDSRRFESP
jgi:hypothetical protein